MRGFLDAKNCEKPSYSRGFRAESILLTCESLRRILSDAPRRPYSLLFSFPFLLRFATLLWTTTHAHSAQGQQSFSKLSGRNITLLFANVVVFLYQLALPP